MPSLLELQSTFMESLFAADAAAAKPIHGCIVANGIPESQRFGVYRNNLHENFRKALAIEFPAIERLVGADYFRQLALQFQQAAPSRSGDLHAIGAGFSAYLQARFAGSEYAYFADVAALEWAWQQCLTAADAPPWNNFDALGAVAPDCYAGICFQAHPALRLISSAWPVFTIWNANRDGSEPAGVIDISCGGECVVLRRAGSGAEARRCESNEYAFLSALATGLPFGAAVDAALPAARTARDAYPPLDVGATLREAIALGLLVGFDGPAK